MSLLEVVRARRTFGGVVAVDDVSFEVRDGEVLSIIGPNGAGKTTLFNLITGTVPLESGDVRFQGRSIAGLSPDRIARLGIGRTFQLVRPFPGMTVRDNVALAALVKHPRRRDAERQAEGVLALFGMGDLAATPAARLPLGLRKRLEIARAVALEPRIVLLDEVMSGLVPTEVDATIEAIGRLQERGIAAVAGVEHVLRVVMKISDRVIVLASGALLAEGKPADVVRDPKVISAYLGSGAAALAAGST